MTAAYTCRICGHRDDNRIFTAREMMLGTRESFDYFECGRCRCLQIARIPDDLARYYPPTYYAGRSSGRLELFLQSRWMRFSLEGRDVLGRLLSRLFGLHAIGAWQRQAGFTYDSAVLDVGCGEGKLLRVMRRAGFTDLTGVDPFMTRELGEPGLVLRRATLDQLEKRFDVIMFHHSFEHVPDPHVTLREAERRLAPGGTILIRIPVADSVAWREYGTDWVQLDAPRHLHLLSSPAMERLAAAHDLEVRQVVHDSTAFQFWGSELYRRDIPYSAKPAYRNRPSRKLISRRQMKAFEERARELNAAGEGDSAAFYLRRKAAPV